jgi:DNA adenine methylase
LHLIDKYKFDSIWINDYDIHLASLWTGIMNNKESLKNYIKDYIPCLNDFFSFKAELLNPQSKDYILLGFKKLAIHQMSFSGLGLKGGPLGGIEQKSEYDIACRWNPKRLMQSIDDNYIKFAKNNIKHNRCTTYDYSYLLQDCDNCLIYLDPPYYHKGECLYQHSFKKEDHEFLAEILKECKNAKWILSYDYCEEIKELYSWAKVIEVNINYTINKKSKQKEYIILSDSMRVAGLF